MKTRNKKATHVGVILSFVIFITFVVFIFIVLKPTSNIQKEGESTALFLKKNIENSISAEITSFILSPLTTADCYTFDETSYTLGSLNHSVKNQDNQNLNSDHTSSTLSIEKTSQDTFYKVDYSPRELNSTIYSNPLGCEALQIDSVRKVDKFIEPKIEELILKQTEDYSSLKQEFNIPSEKEFGINFTFENKSSIGKNPPDKKKATYIKKFQIIYLDLNATERVGNFIIYVM